MKRFTMILALMLMVAMPMMAERVTPETAQKVAKTFLNNNGVKSAQLTDLTSAAGFSNLYIFSGEEGFVVMAADDCVQPILGYSLTGEFVAEGMPENIRGWLQGYNDEIQYAIDNQMRATSETAKTWKDLIDGNAKAGKATTIVSNLLSTTWNQDPYYNDMCPYDSQAGELTVTGCVATAMAQIMKYWGYPTHGIGSYSYTPEAHPEYGVQSANFGATTYAWNDMPNELTSSSTTTQKNAIATLMYHCGVSVSMDYDIAANGGSGASTPQVVNALKNYFGYQQSTYKSKDDYENTWVSMLKTELDNGRPLQYSGRGTGGHSFICCGYDSSDMFWFNWGWGGHNDAFYALNDLVPGSGGSGGANYSFNNEQGAIFGIQPVQCAADEPSNLTYTLSGIQNLTLNWTAANGAASYNIYCNNIYVGNSTTNSYTEVAPFGTNVYYVRSVDANGNLSLPSNTVTFYIGYQTPIVDDLTASLSGNNVNLSWTAPEWCYPEEPSATFTYGDGIYVSSIGSANPESGFYWGHRYLANNLAPYNGKIIYKISFYVNEPGAYDCYVFKGTAQYNTSYYPTQELAHLSITTSKTGWLDLDLSETIEIDGSQDLWVFVYDPVGRQYPATYCSFSENINGSYYANYYPIANVSGYLLGTANGKAWLIRTLVTDGTYTYNLYDGNTRVASNISNTTYTINNITNNAAHRYTLKTNYYGGETNASNLAGLTLGTASLSSLTMNANDNMTVTENSQLTVTGTLSDVNADNLILEDGAQLINSSTGVKATVKKDITAYTQDGGWYLLASPIAESITPTVDNGFLANNYDFFTFSQSEQLEWRNYEIHNFTIDNKTGYLYANSGNPTLSFAGTLVANTTPTTLVYDNNAGFKGFNLIGNPYPCNTNVDRSFYVLNEDGSDFIIGSNPIPPYTSIMVQAQGTGENVTFSKTASKNRPGIVATVKTLQGKGEEVIDKARVSFEENDNLAKFTIGQHPTQLYIPQDKQNYAVAFANDQSEMPLNFKAAKNGTYVLDFKVENMKTNYLHLIDNMTGIDVDLLTTPSYVFEASTDNYEARFRLVLAPICEDANGGNENFAYYANGEIHIIETQSFASLQIVDLTGRILVSRDMVRHISTANMAPGIYVLRLISGEQVKTQKIVLQ